MEPIRIAAFAKDGAGGNAAGVVIAAQLPSPARMQATAAALGYSETVFAARDETGWRVRYFAPMGEVAFCGHATIALGAALGRAEGPGVFVLNLRDAQITVAAEKVGEVWTATLQSPPTWSCAMSPELLDALLPLFGLTPEALDPALPPLVAFAGVRHAVLCLSDRETLARMAYPFDPMRALMAQHDLVTVSLLHVTCPRAFAARNAFASGGVVEDPATGAAAAALGGALVDRDWDGLRLGGTFEIVQGADMGSPSRLWVQVNGTPGASVKVTGAVRWL